MRSIFIKITEGIVDADRPTERADGVIEEQSCRNGSKRTFRRLDFTHSVEGRHQDGVGLVSLCASTSSVPIAEERLHGPRDQATLIVLQYGPCR